MNQIEQVANEYENILKDVKREGLARDMHNSPSMFINNKQKQNLIEFELDFKPELEDIKRLLRCDVIKRDENGIDYWAINPDKSKVFFNELGVNDLIRNIIILVNKGKALSNYDSTEINARVRQIKHELRILIYNNYEQYGMDNEYKMNNYTFIVISIGSIIEDIYRRAMNGETHRSLSEQRLVTQTEPLSNQMNPYQMNNIQPKKKLYNPLTWFR